MTTSPGSLSARGIESEFLHWLGIELVELRKDRCTMQLQVEARHTNKQGSIHGGVTATLLDAACAHATISLDDHSALGRGVTLMMSVSYMGQAQAGQILRAEAIVDRRGRQIAYCSARLLTQDATLIASAQGAFKFTAPGTARPAEK